MHLKINNCYPKFRKLNLRFIKLNFEGKTNLRKLKLFEYENWKIKKYYFIYFSYFACHVQFISVSQKMHKICYQKHLFFCMMIIQCKCVFQKSTFILQIFYHEIINMIVFQVLFKINKWIKKQLKWKKK